MQQTDGSQWEGAVVQEDNNQRPYLHSPWETDKGSEKAWGTVEAEWMGVRGGK